VEVESEKIIEIKMPSNKRSTKNKTLLEEIFYGALAIFQCKNINKYCSQITSLF